MSDAQTSFDPTARTTASIAPDSESVQEELQKVVSSEMFAGASRLGDLLEYIVQQNLADQSRKIFAKTIAEEIYGRAPDQDGDNQNIVRVDAGRLRRRLSEYYAGPGMGDPLFIHIDPGAYVPRYEVRQPPEPVPATPPLAAASKRSSKNGSLVLAGMILIALGVGFGLGAFLSPWDSAIDTQPLPREQSGDPKLEAERRARLAKSPSSLQAVTLSDQARNLIFPMFETTQLELSLAMFREAMRKDPSYFGGYAGASQCLGALAVLMPEGPERSARLVEARQMADHAEDLSPENSWTQSALSWVLHAEGQVAQAKEHAEIALNLAPLDGNVLDFYAMLMLSIGEFESARLASDRERPRTSGLGRFANRSINGAANFHLGNYQDAVDSLNAATVSGDPISAPTLAYLAASQMALGRTKLARRHVVELSESWPGFDPTVSLNRLYSDPNQVTMIVSMLAEAGWLAKASPNQDQVPKE